MGTWIYQTSTLAVHILLEPNIPGYAVISGPCEANNRQLLSQLAPRRWDDSLFPRWSVRVLGRAVHPLLFTLLSHWKFVTDGQREKI